MSLTQKEFLISDISLDQIYANFDEQYQVSKFNPQKVKKAYGKLRFPIVSERRPLLIGCFVNSIDGTIAFEDNKTATKIARVGDLYSNGGKTDFWLLNLLRAVADGIILGPKTLQVEPNLTGHIFDSDLIKSRLKLLNKPKVPYNIIVSKTGESIPYQHRIFSEKLIPLVIATSPYGVEYISENINCNYQIIDLAQNSKTKEKVLNSSTKVNILVTGQGYDLDEKQLFGFLKSCGLNKIVVETPSYAHYLIRHKMLDELFLNQSGVYIGGNTYLNNDYNLSFESTDAPHTKMITIHNYNSRFFYFRYKLLYS